jgi:hypothetical protein
MATIINSSTNPQGLIQTSDGTAVLKIQTDDLDALTIDASQNVTVNNNLTVSGQVSSNLIPSSNVTYDLGSASNQWKDLYLSGNTIFLGGAQLSYTGTSFKVSVAGEDVLETNTSGVSSANIISFFDADSSNFVALQAPTTVSSNVTFSLPSAVPSATGDCLISDTSGNMSFAPRATTGKAIAMAIVFGG